MEEKTEIIIDVRLTEEQIAERLSAVTQEIKLLKDISKEAAKERERDNTTWKENTKTITENEAKIKLLTGTQKALEGQYTKMLGIGEKYGSSLHEQRAALANMNKQVAALTKEQLKNDPAAKEMLKNQAELTKEVKESEKQMGIHNREVGNYEIAGKSLRAELKSMTAELASMAQAGLAGTESYNNLAKEAGNLRDALNDATEQINAFARDTKNIDAVIGTVQGIAASFGVVKGTMAALGLETEKAEETMKKLQAIMTVLISLQQIQNLAQKQSIVYQTAQNALQKIGIVQTVAESNAIKAKTAFMTADTVATKIATGVTWAWNSALSSNPVGLLLTAVMSLIVGINLFSKKTKEAADENLNYNRVLEEQKKALSEIEQLHDKVEKTLAREIERLKNQGASIEEIKKKEKELADLRLANATQRKEDHQKEVYALETNKRLLKEYEKELLRIKDASGNVDVKLEGWRNAKLDVKDFRKFLEEQIGNFTAKIEIATKVITDEDEAKKVLQDIEDKEKEAAKERAKVAHDIEVENMKKIRDLNIAIISDNETRELAARNEKLKRDIEALKGSEKQKKEIRELLEKEARKDIKEIEKKYADAALNVSQERIKEELRIRLELAEKGSNDAFEIEVRKLERERIEAITKAKETGVDVYLINEEFAQKSVELTEKYIKIQQDAALKALKETAEQEQLAFDNELLRLGDDEQAKADLIIKTEQSKLNALVEMDAAAKEAMGLTQDQYENLVLQSQQKIDAAQKASMQLQQQNTQKMLQNLGAVSSSMKDLFNALAEDNEEMAVFIKAMALFEIGAKTAVAIVNAINGATAAGAATGPAAPFTTPAFILEMVGITVSAITSAIENFKPAPTAPKFSGGGIVPGTSFTGDKVPALLNSKEMVLNMQQQRRLFDSIESGNIGTGFDYDALTSAFIEGVKNIPPNTLDYSEFTLFQRNLLTIKERTIL